MKKLIYTRISKVTGNVVSKEKTHHYDGSLIRDNEAFFLMARENIFKKRADKIIYDSLTRIEWEGLTSTCILELK